MKKKKYPISDGKIVPFPNLHKRLTEKGMDALQKRNFQDALEYFQQATSLDFQPNVELATIVCLFELGELDEAKHKCKKLLQEDVSDYYQVLHIYVTILVQQGEYNEVQSILEAVIDENRLPAKHAENLFKILDFSRKMNQDKQIEQQQVITEQEYEEINQHLNISNTIHDHWHTIQKLRESNLNKVLPLLVTFLQDSKKHPMLKTMVLELLKEQGMDADLTVEKFGTTQKFNPALLQNVIDYSYTNEVLSLSMEKIGDKNPTLFEVIKEIWLRHLFVLYPFLPKPESPSNWAAALHKIGCEMHGIDIKDTTIEGLYQVSKNEMVACYNSLIEIEEISLLQI